MLFCSLSVKNLSAILTRYVAWYSKQTLGSTLIYHNINQKIRCRCQDDRHTKADNIGRHYGM